MNLKVLISVFCVVAVTACSAPQQIRNYSHVSTANNASVAIPISRTQPQYPRQAAINRIEGSVTLSHRINQDGRPTHIKVVNAQPEGMFERAAIRALKGWRFAPPDTPGRLTYLQTLDFIMGDPFDALGEVHPEPSLVSVDELDEAPVILVRIHPAYPVAALEAGQHGSVTIEFTIGVDGRTSDAVITDSSPPNVFDEATLTALQKWLFRPGIKNGYRVSIRAVQVFSFNPEEFMESFSAPE